MYNETHFVHETILQETFISFNMQYNIYHNYFLFFDK